MKGNLFLLIAVVCLLSACGSDNSKGNNTQTSEVAVLTVSHAPKYEFGVQPVDSFTEKSFTVTNLGQMDATEVSGDFYLSLSFGYKGGSFPGEGGTCLGELKSKESCTLVVVFNPKDLGFAQTTLILSYHNGAFDTSVNGPALTGQGI